MKDVLKRMFEPPDDITTLLEVVKRLSATRYEVKDHAGRKSAVTVGKNEIYAKGQTVMVVNGRIDNTAKPVGKHKIYEV